MSGGERTVGPDDGATPILEARDVGRIGLGKPLKTWLLNKVTFSLRAGERVALLGPSGAGKTLLLRALALLDPIDAGIVVWRGRAVRGDDVPCYRGQVMYLQQRPALFPGSVADNLRHPFALRVHRGRSFDRSRIVVLLDELGRDPSFLDKSHRDLSGGEAQIVALLRAIQLDPVVLLLDEPTAALDRASAQSIETLVLRWHGAPTSFDADRRACVWVTHDHDQANRVTDRTIRVHGGMIENDSTPPRVAKPDRQLDREPTRP